MATDAASIGKDLQNSSSLVPNADTGLGTTYERWALNRFLANMSKETGIHNLLEGPGDGMTGIPGINSLVLGRKGIKVTVLLPDLEQANIAQRVWDSYAPEMVHLHTYAQDIAPLDHYQKDEFDLVWNFNILSSHSTPPKLLEQMCRISRNYVLIFVPNSSNYSFFLHRLQHSVKKRKWSHGPIELMSPLLFIEMFQALGFRISEPIWLDCPWWPDIVDFGQLIADFFPFLGKFADRVKPGNRYLWPADQLPYFDPDRFPEIHQKLAGLAFFENSRFAWLKKRFAHHVGILAEKM